MGKSSDRFHLRVGGGLLLNCYLKIKFYENEEGETQQQILYVR